MRRLAQLSYLFLTVGFGVFVASFATVVLVEAYGPSHVDEGRVIERIEGERTVTRCVQGGTRRCRSTTYPTYTVIGERDDGTTWIVVGEGPYDAMRGERGLISVATSDITGRVVELDGGTSRRRWQVKGSSMMTFAIGAVVVIGGIIVLWEFVRRRSDRHPSLESIDRANLWMVVPAALAGLALTWFVTFAKGYGLDAASSSERYGTFLSDPLDFVSREIERDPESEDGVPTGVFVSNGGVAVAIVDPVELGDGPRAELDAHGGFAIPVVREDRWSSSSRDRVTFAIVVDDVTMVESIDCPDEVTAFPTVIGEDPAIRAGFVCFPDEAEGAPLTVTIGTGFGAKTSHLAYRS